MSISTPPAPDPVRYIAQAVRLARSGRPLVFYDTETTGLYDEGAPPPRPWQIAAIRRQGGTRVVAQRILKVGMPLPTRVCEICRVPPDLPEQRGREPAVVLPQFAAFISGAIMIGHNSVAYDNRVMADAYRRAQLPVPAQFAETDVVAHLRAPVHSIDTRLLAQAVLVDCLPRHLRTPREVALGPGERGGLALGPLGRYLGLSFDASRLHDGSVDVALCELVFDELLARGAAILRASGIQSLPRSA